MQFFKKLHRLAVMPLLALKQQPLLPALLSHRRSMEAKVSTHCLEEDEHRALTAQLDLSRHLRAGKGEYDRVLLLQCGQNHRHCRCTRLLYLQRYQLYRPYTSDRLLC
jgi:hypothetical protein